MLIKRLCLDVQGGEAEPPGRHSQAEPGNEGTPNIANSEW